MRRYLPVQVLGVLLAVGSLTSVSTPFGIGDIVVRTPIVLSNAAARVIRAVTDSAAKTSAVGAVPPSRRVAPAGAEGAASRPAAVAHPARLELVRNPETISLRHRIDERNSEPVKLRTTKRERVKHAVARELKQHRREIEQRNRHQISPVRTPRRPHRPPSIHPLHRP